MAALYGPDALRERLAHADVVMLTVPLSKAAHHLIGVAELWAMENVIITVHYAGMTPHYHKRAGDLPRQSATLPRR